MTRAEKQRKLRALERMLEGEPPYPSGTIVREMQDERDAIRKELSE